MASMPVPAIARALTPAEPMATNAFNAFAAEAAINRDRGIGTRPGRTGPAQPAYSPPDHGDRIARPNAVNFFVW
jgi:hypothetical protein